MKENGVSLAGFPPEPSLRGRLLIGVCAVFFGVFGIFGWSVMASISGAIIAGGQVIVESDPKKVQHQQGGIVGEINVRNGARVKAGDVLVKLDETLSRTNLAQVVSQLMQLMGRRSRLEAERDARDTLILPADFNRFGPEAADIAQAEQRLLHELRASRDAQKRQLLERIGQFEREIEGLKAQGEAKIKESSYIAQELKGVEELFRKNLVPIAKLMQLQREAARLNGDSGALVASIAKSRGQIAEINMQLITIDQVARTEANKELREVEASISQLAERRIAALDILNRVDIRAPQSGFVHEASVHTIGGVIAPGETIMLIIPDADKLSIEVRISPADIDQVHIGQKATLRLSAFNQRTTPEVAGQLTRIAADLTREVQTGAMYYVARLAIDEAEFSKLKGLVLLPGMPIEAFIETGERTPFSYFAKPITDAFARAFREE